MATADSRHGRRPDRPCVAPLGMANLPRSATRIGHKAKTRKTRNWNESVAAEPQDLTRNGASLGGLPRGPPVSPDVSPTPWSVSPRDGTLRRCTLALKSWDPRAASPSDWPTTSIDPSNCPWPRRSTTRSRAATIWWSRRAPASARALPIWCPPSWPPPGGAAGQGEDRQREARAVPRGHLHPHDQPAGTADRTRTSRCSTASSRWSSRPCWSRAGATTSACGGSTTALERAGSLFSSDEEFDQLRQLGHWAKKPRDGSLSRPRLSSRSRGRLGRSGQRQRQLPGPKLPDVQGLLLLSGPAARVQRPDPDRQSRLVLQRSGPAAGRASSILPDYDVVIFDEAHNARSRGRRPPGHERHQRARSTTC